MFSGPSVTRSEFVFASFASIAMLCHLEYQQGSCRSARQDGPATANWLRFWTVNNPPGQLCEACKEAQRVVSNRIMLLPKRVIQHRSHNVANLIPKYTCQCFRTAC